MNINDYKNLRRIKDKTFTEFKENVNYIELIYNQRKAVAEYLTNESIHPTELSELVEIYNLLTENMIKCLYLEKIEDAENE